MTFLFPSFKGPALPYSILPFLNIQLSFTQLPLQCHNMQLKFVALDDNNYLLDSTR